jgi:hypothetical protein
MDIVRNNYYNLHEDDIKVYHVFCSQMTTKQLITHILFVDKYIYPQIEIRVEYRIELKYPMFIFDYFIYHEHCNINGVMRKLLH